MESGCLIFQVIKEREVSRRSMRDSNEEGRSEENFDEGELTKKRVCFLDLLLDLKDAGEISQDEVRQQVDTFMFEVITTFISFLNDKVKK